MYFDKPPQIVRSKDEALVALRALSASGAYDMSYAIKYVELTSVIPELLNMYKPGVWYVRHGQYVSQTFAIGEREAINNVRARVYGSTTPELECPSFEAVCPFEIVVNAVSSFRGSARRAIDATTTTIDLFGKRKLSPREVMMRIKRMAI